jgi:hypothetical protein
MPWEMMLESDIDLTKSLARHNVSVERSNWCPALNNSSLT